MGNEKQAAIVKVDSLLNSLKKQISPHSAVQGCLLFRTESGEVAQPLKAFEVTLTSDRGERYTTTFNRYRSGQTGEKFRNGSITITPQTANISDLPVRLR
jgi:hypothetical protein